MFTDLTFAAAIRSWWRQPDHFDWFSEYLRSRGVASFIRCALAATVLSLALLAVEVLLGNAGPRDPVPTLLGWVCVGGGILCAGLWALRWPSKRQSQVYVVTLTLSIAVFCQIPTHPLVGVVAAICLVIPGCHIACFHTAPMLFANIAVAGLVAGLQSLRCLDMGASLAAPAFGLVLLVNVAVPTGVQGLVHALGTDVVRSDMDALTGLLNRRAFFERVDQMLRARAPHQVCLLVTMVDLDRFKALNDTLGHAVGDQALTAVGRMLQATVRPEAAIGRVGGEEFLIAELDGDCAPAGEAQRICDAIAALPYGLTASLGTTAGRINQLATSQLSDSIDRLCQQADIAMYAAKRNGGNQIQVGTPSSTDVARNNS